MAGFLHQNKWWKNKSLNLVKKEGVKMLSITNVIINREKYYPHTFICPICGERLRFVKKTRTVACSFCDFSDIATEADKKEFIS